MNGRTRSRLDVGDDRLSPLLVRHTDDGCLCSPEERRFLETLTGDSEQRVIASVVLRLSVPLRADQAYPKARHWGVPTFCASLELVTGVRAVAAGDAVISPGLTRKLIDTFSQRLPGHSPQQQARLDELTQREREVLTAVASGWTNTEIAARDRVQAVIFAYDTGLVHPA